MMAKEKYVESKIEVVDKDVLKSRHKEFCTNSVLKFLKQNDELVVDYIEEVRDRDKMPNYSDFLRKVMGTTAEKVNLASIYVIRSQATKYLVNRYRELYPEEVDY